MFIREMDRLDIERIRVIAFDTWRDTYSKFIPEDVQDRVLKDAYSNEKMEDRFKSSLNLVTEDNEEMIGYAFFSGNLFDKDVYLESLYVHPHHQGKGLGRKLLLTGLEKFKNPTTVSLTVYQGNPNISFYEKEGFKVIGEKKGDFFGHPIVFTKMEKNLN